MPKPAKKRDPKITKKSVKKEILKKLELAFKEYKVRGGKKKLQKSLVEASKIISPVALKTRKRIDPKGKK